MKPKAFIIQVCQGSSYTEGVSTVQADDVPSDDEEIEEDDQLGEKADQLWAMATVSKYKAFRDTKKGSWFICDLVKTIKKCKEQDHFLEILTKVCREVADPKGGVRGYKKLPCIRETTLRKKWLL